MWRRKRNEWLPTTLGRYNGSNNGQEWVSGTHSTGLDAGGPKVLRDGGVVAEHKYKRMASICYVGVATEATEPPHAPRNTSRASATTTRLYPINQDPIPRVSNYLQPAGRHTRRRPANSPPAASYGARRGHTPLAEPKSLPPDASSTENAIAALV